MSSGGGTTVQKADPWTGSQPYLMDLMGQAANQYRAQPGNTYPTLSPMTQLGLNGTAMQAMQGAPTVDSANNVLQGFMSGQGLSNPYLDSQFQNAASQVRDTVNAQFTGAGRTGSGANQDVLEKNLNNLATSMYGGAYNDGMNRMLGAAQLAPGATAASYIPSQAMTQAGQTYDQQNLSQYNAPWDALAHYSGIVTGMGGSGGAGGIGGSKSTTEPGQSAVPQLLGSTAQYWMPYLLSAL